MSHSKEHDALFEPCVKWLEQNYQPVRVAVEPHKLGLGGRSVIPDVIAWTPGYVLCVDAKVSREDAANQLSKNDRAGTLGTHSWIARPAHTADEPWPMPDGWGELLVDDDGNASERVEPRRSRGNPGMALAMLLELLKSEGRTQAAGRQAEKPKGRAKLTATQHEAVSVRVAADGMTPSWVPAKSLHVNVMHVVHDAEAGLIPGVVSRGTPAILYAKGLEPATGDAK